MMKIIYKTNLDEALAHEILVTLKSRVSNLTLLEMSSILGAEYREGNSNWNILKLHLWYLADQGKIEEIHYGENAGDKNGVVEYSIEQKGLDDLSAHEVK